MIRGLDVSWCQGAIDWAKVPAEFRFVIIKVSEGGTGKDPARLRNIQDAHATGRAVGVYHFLRPSQDALMQVQGHNVLVTIEHNTWNNRTNARIRGFGKAE